VVDRNRFKPVITGIALLKTIRELYPEDFKWRNPPYEYVFDRNPFDVIAGTDRLRGMIESGAEITDIEAWWREDEQSFLDTRSKYLMY
jgi:uncharacterized protein YbbC (DUF1343 family)